MLPPAKGWTRLVNVMCALGVAACGETPNGSRSPSSAGASGSAPTAGASSNGTAGAPTAEAGASGFPPGGAAGGAGQPAGGVGGSGGVSGLGGAGIAGESGGGAGAAAGAAAGTTSSAGTGQGAAALALTDLIIEENPNLTLSCFVSWTTAEPASSEVEFGEGGYQLRIRDASLVTQHRVLVIGMHAATEYQLKAVSATALATGSAEGTFTTAALPADIPTPTLTASDPSASEGGWTLTNVQEGSKTKPSMIVMYDEAGLPVWYFIHGPSADTRGDVPATLNAGLVLIGATIGESPREVDLSGTVVWQGPPQTTADAMSHYVGKTSTGNYLLNRELDKVVQSGGSSLDDQRLQEVSPDRDVLWSWDFSDHLTLSAGREDFCHGNSIHFDESESTLYLSCRFLGVIKIDRGSGDVLWRLGGGFDTTSLGPGDFTFDPPASRFSDIHDPEIHDDGTMLFYDNGGYTPNLQPTRDPMFHSRVVEYAVDQAAKTATLTFEFPGSFAVDDWYKTQWYSPYWGGADRLANGNVLVTAGVRSADLSTRIFEVSRAGRVVWELTFPPNHGSFQAQRLSPPPLVERIP